MAVAVPAGYYHYMLAVVPFGASLVASAFCPFDRAAVRPAATPPGWVFPVVWYTLYALMGAAWYRAARPGAAAGGSSRAGGLLSPASCALAVVQGLLALWTYTQSCRRRDRESTWVLLAIVLAVSYAVLLSDDTGRLLLLPMLVWCSFATYLNAEKASMTSAAGGG